MVAAYTLVEKQSSCLTQRLGISLKLSRKALRHRPLIVAQDHDVRAENFIATNMAALNGGGHLSARIWAVRVFRLTANPFRSGRSASMGEEGDQNYDRDRYAQHPKQD